MESSIRFLISVLTLVLWVTSSFAHAGNTFSYVLEDGSAEIRSYCTQTHSCFPIRLELRESNNVVLSTDITKDSLNSWLTRLNTAGALLADFRTQTVHLLGTAPNKITDVVSILVSAPLETGEHSARVKSLANGHAVNRAVFQELARIIWAESGYTPSNHSPIEFQRIDKPIRVLGRGIIKSKSDETLYLACLLPSAFTNECDRYQFILEKPMSAERATIGSPFQSQGDDPLRDILTNRIEQILNGIDFRKFYGSLEPQSGWSNLKGPYSYSGEEKLPSAFRNEWRMLTSRAVSDWQFRPIEISEKSFDEILGILQFDERIFGKPCVGRPVSIRQLDENDGNRDKDFDALYRSLKVDFDRNSYPDRIHFAQMEFFFRYFFGNRTCSKIAPAEASYRYLIKAKKNSVCIEWRVFDGRATHKLSNNCKKNWSFTELATELNQAAHQAQNFFIRANKRTAREERREESDLSW